MIDDDASLSTTHQLIEIAAMCIVFKRNNDVEYNIHIYTIRYTTTCGILHKQYVEGVCGN